MMVWRMLLRDWRGGELGVLLAALVVAVAIVSGISAFTTRLQSSLEQESHRFLAADLAVAGSRQYPKDWQARADALGLASASTLAFPSMLLAGDGAGDDAETGGVDGAGAGAGDNTDAGEDTGFEGGAMYLSSIKAVSDRYPLRGDLLMSEQPFGPAVRAPRGPAPGTVWLDSRLFPLLDVAIGDRVSIGDASFTVTGAVRAEPDRAGGFMPFGPRVLMHLDDIPATAVVRPGSRVEYRLLLAGAPGLIDAYREWLRPRLSGHRLLDVGDSQRGIGGALDRAERFLLLAGSLGVVLAGVAIALAARRFSERHYDYVAIMKSLGASAGRVNRIYGLSLVSIGAVAVVLGSALGWAMQAAFFGLFAQALPVVPGPSGPRPYIIGAATALLCLLSFAWPPLRRLGFATPLKVLRRDLPNEAGRGIADHVVGLGAVLLLMLWYSGDPALTLAVLAGLLASAGLAGVAAWLLLRGGRLAGMRAGSVWRLALASLQRRGGANTLQVVVFSLAIMLLLILVLVRTSLVEEWQMQLPAGTPNHFLVNIAPEEVNAVRESLHRRAVLSQPLYPMIRGRLVTVNGMPLARGGGGAVAGDSAGAGGEDYGRGVGEADGGAGSADGASGGGSGRVDGGSADGGSGPASNNPRREREINLTWSAALPPGNELVGGAWWPDDTAAALVSVEEEFAARLGIAVGDRLGFLVGARPLQVTVSSLRRLDWQSMQPNFFMVFPPAVLQGYPATFMTSFHLDAADKSFLNSFIRAFPTVSVVEMDVVIRQVRGIIAQVSAAIELVLAVILAAGALVLIAGVQASVDARLHEGAILRALGASRRLIMGALVIEFAVLGLFAGALATVAAEIAAFILQTEVLEMGYSVHPLLWGLGPLVAVVLIGALGVWNTRRVVSSPPLLVLREL